MTHIKFMEILQIMSYNNISEKYRWLPLLISDIKTQLGRQKHKNTGDVKYDS